MSLQRLSAFPLVVFLLLSLAGCERERDERVGVSSVNSQGSQLTPSTNQALEDSLKRRAKVRRDGNGQIIEVDLRETKDADVIAILPQLPKIRSLLLTDVPVTDEMLDVIARIKTLENLDLRGCPISDRGIQPLSSLSKLKSIRLSGKNGQTKVTSEAMKTLAEISTLKVIAADFLPIGDTGVSHLRGLSDLRELYLASTGLTESSCEVIGEFRMLTKLRLAGTAIGDSFAEQLKSLSRLTELDVSDCTSVGDPVVLSAAGLPELVKLNVYATSVGDASWAAFGDAEKLKWLNVDRTKITDAALEPIGKYRSLEFLHLGSTVVSDEGMPSLENLPSLKKLIVTRTNVSQNGVTALSDKMPNLEIQLKYEPGK